MPKKYLNLIKFTKPSKRKNKITGTLKKFNFDAKCALFTNPKLLHTIQMSNIYKDSKTFVDMVTKTSESEVLSNFAKLGDSPSTDDLKRFLDENFYEAAGHDLVTPEPRDWVVNAPFLAKVTDERIANFGRFLNSKWKMLLRNFDKTKVSNNSKSTLILTKNTFVVPGGRFIEYYYWDTYWIVEGLLSCGMIQTARGIIENFADIIRQAGFVPNGSRVYYLNRSQPPLFTQMVYAYYKVTGDLKLVEECLDHMDKEYEYWMSRKAVRVEINGERFKLNVYNVRSNEPRPESYKEDFHNAGQTNDKDLYFSNIMSATESGWDFSSRWFQDPMDIKTIHITNMIPVDLNSIMFRNEAILHEFHKTLCTRRARFYEQAIRKRQRVMNTLMWDKTLFTWGDYDIANKKINTDYLYISDLTPLWAGIEPPVEPSLILARYKSILMDHVSGIPASNVKSGQQWDFPNVWAPYHHWMVEYFRRIAHNDIALDIAKRFVNTVYQGWVNTNYIFEKYNADELGVYGGGGEYVVQEGFGWTNGVVIKFIEWFGDEIKLEPQFEKQLESLTISTEQQESLTSIEENKQEEAAAEAQEMTAKVEESSSETSVINIEAKPAEEVDENKPDLSSIFSTEEQVRRRQSEVISQEISNEISVSIQHMEI